MATALDESVPSSTSAYCAKATIPESPVQVGDHHMTSHYPPSLRPLVLEHDQTTARPLEQSLSLQQNCHPVAIQRLPPIELHKVPTHLLVTTQQLQGRSKVSPLHIYHNIYNSLSQHINLLCTPYTNKHTSLAPRIKFLLRSSICHTAHTQPQIWLCNWLHGTTALTLLQKPFISFSAICCTR